MKNRPIEKSAVLTAIGAAVMVLLTATKVAPSSKIAGYSVFVGLAFFFIVEAVAKTPRPESDRERNCDGRCRQADFRR